MSSYSIGGQRSSTDPAVALARSNSKTEPARSTSPPLGASNYTVLPTSTATQPPTHAFVKRRPYEGTPSSSPVRAGSAAQPNPAGISRADSLIAAKPGSKTSPLVNSTSAVTLPSSISGHLDKITSVSSAPAPILTSTSQSALFAGGTVPHRHDSMSSTITPVSSPPSAEEMNYYVPMKSVTGIRSGEQQLPPSPLPPLLQKSPRPMSSFTPASVIPPPSSSYNTLGLKPIAPPPSSDRPPGPTSTPPMSPSTSAIKGRTPVGSPIERMFPIPPQGSGSSLSQSAGSNSPLRPRGSDAHAFPFLIDEDLPQPKPLSEGSRDFVNTVLFESLNAKELRELAGQLLSHAENTNLLKNALKQLVTGDNYSAVLDLTRSIATASQLSPKAAQGSANSNGAGYALVAARSGGTLTSPSAAVKDWNNDFQTLQMADNNIHKWESLRNLAEDFAYAAETYGRIIISEAYLSDSEKTIKPVDLGGRAGGTKYIVQGILFKFALDTEGFYASDEGAAKAAGHELKGLQAYYNARVPALCTPLMVLIDYRGFRLTCISLLPIDRSTIAYGSCDGGHTVHTDIQELNELMRIAAQQINLKGHYVDDKLLFAPGDIEGHLGKDGRYYVVDCARVFPPETPPQNLDEMEKGALLFKLLRPEHVKGLLTPLSSDSYSGFQRSDRDYYTHNRETKEAFDLLISEVIPNFAYKLEKGFDEAKSSSTAQLQTFSQKFHRSGVNARFLNLVRHFVSKPLLRKLLISEAAARVIKSILRAKLREKQKLLRIPSEHPYRKLVIDFINMVIGGDENEAAATNRFWNEEVFAKMLRRFPVYVSEDGSENDARAIQDLRREVDMVHCVRLLCQMQGIQLTEKAMNEFITQPDNFQLIHPDLLGFVAKSKQMSIIYEAQDNWLISKAQQSDTKESRRCLWSIVRHSSEQRVNHDSKSLLMWGSLLFNQALHTSGEDCLSLLAAADEKYELALAGDESDPKMFADWGALLSYWGYLLRVVDSSGSEGDYAADTVFKRAGDKYNRAMILGRQTMEVPLVEAITVQGAKLVQVMRSAAYSPLLHSVLQQKYSHLSSIVFEGCSPVNDQIVSQLATDLSERLMHLNLRGCLHVTDASIVPLVQKCVRLAFLELSFCRVSDKSVAEMHNLSLLSTLHLGGCSEVSVRMLTSLMKKLTGLRTLVIPNELSSAIKSLSALNANTKVKPEAPSKYDLMTFSERKGALHVLKFTSSKWIQCFLVLEKERILLYHAKDSAGAPKEELVLDVSTICDKVSKDDKRAPDSMATEKAKGGVGSIDKQFCFRIRCGSLESRNKVPPRTRYFSGESTEERDAWILAISNNVTLLRERNQMLSSKLGGGTSGRTASASFGSEV